jgi:hypothetical protein
MRAAEQGQIYALLANAHLLTVHQDGTTVADTALDPDSSSNSPRATGHYLALATDKRRVYVLVPLQPLAVDQIVAVNVGSAEIENTYALPDGVYHSIAVGPLTGHLFVFGNLAGGVIVTIIDPADGAPLSTWVARPEDGHKWTVYQGSVSADEQHLYVSYHGPDTTGLDWFDVASGGLVRCASLGPPNFGCIASHGGFTVLPHELLVGTGDPVILDVDSSGAIRKGFDTGLVGNHLMEFVVDPAAQRLYAVGSCGYTGGFSAVSLEEAGLPLTTNNTGQWTWLTKPHAPLILLSAHPCGERLSLGPSGLVVGSTAQPVPQAGRHGSLLVVDPKSGNVTQRIEIASEPLDVLALPAASLN